MNTIDRLREDHQRLSVKLTVLESALTLGAEAQFVVRESCYAASKQLRQHIRREERVVATCHRDLGRVSAEELDWFAIEHDEASRYLQIVNGLLWGESGVSLDGICDRLMSVITSLRSQMQEQEVKLFPFLELTASLSSVFEEQGLPVSGRLLLQTMTIQQVLDQYPLTREVLAKFYINEFTERYDTLAEVAWRHGVDSHTLLAHLEEAITSAVVFSAW